MRLRYSLLSVTLSYYDYATLYSRLRYHRAGPRRKKSKKGVFVGVLNAHVSRVHANFALKKFQPRRKVHSVLVSGPGSLLTINSPNKHP